MVYGHCIRPALCQTWQVFIGNKKSDCSLLNYNPMIRATNSIAVRFDTIVKTLETLILSQLEKNH